MKSAILTILVMFAIYGFITYSHTIPNSPPKYNIEKAFVHEGCTVYKFTEGNFNKFHYFANCHEIH